MKTEFTICVWAFPVRVYDHKTQTEREETVVLTKEQLQAAQLVGQSNEELIHRICDREQLTVEEIGKPEKREITVNLEEFYRAFCLHETGKRERISAAPHRSGSC